MALSLAAVEVGQYLNAWKAIPLVVMLLVWGRLITWADKDSVKVHLPRVVMNIMQMATGIAGFFLFFVLPNFWIASSAMVVCVLAGTGAYFGMRAQKHGLGDLSGQFTDWVRSFATKEKKVKEVEDELMICDTNGNPVAAPSEDSPERGGYDAIQRLLIPALMKNAERIDLTPAEGGAKLVFHVDGMIYSGGTATKDIATMVIDFLKHTSGLKVEEKRKPQNGKLKTVFNGKKRELQITSSGSSAGESLMLQADLKKRHERRLENLGLLPEQEQLIRDAIADPSGIVLVAAPKQQGLTSLMYGILRGHDAFLSHILTVERHPDQDLEGITQNALAPGATPADEYKQVSWTFSQEPDVVAITSIEEPQSAREAARFGAGKRVYIGIRAADTLSAIQQWRKWIGDDEVALANLRLVVAGRLVRKLCPQCKLSFAPDPAQLRKLNLDPAQVTELFQARQEPMRDPKGNPIPCDFCQDLHYKGRLGVYEVLKVDEDLRAAIAAGASSKSVAHVFRKQKAYTMQDAGIAYVAAGETSLQEISRVLRADDSVRKSTATTA